MTKALSNLLNWDKALLGFDYLNNFDWEAAYPRYNVIKNDNGFQLDLLVPGLSKEDITVSVKSGLLTIEAKKIETEDTATYKGFSTKAFKRSFTINQEYEVKKVALDKGILSIIVEKSKVEPENILQIE